MRTFCNRFDNFDKDFSGFVNFTTVGVNFVNKVDVSILKDNSEGKRKAQYQIPIESRGVRYFW